MSRIKRWIEEQIGTEDEQYLDNMYWEQYQKEYEMYEEFCTSDEKENDK